MGQQEGKTRSLPKWAGLLSVPIDREDIGAEVIGITGHSHGDGRIGLGSGARGSRA